MIKLQPEMIDAIAHAVDAAGSQMEFERKTGIRQSTINKILNHKSKSIADRTWRDLLPFVKIGNNAIIQTVNGHHNIGNVDSNCESAMIDKILKSNLTPEEKIKFIELVRK